MKFISKELFVMGSIAVSGVLLARGTEVLKVESILDRLEARLLEEESETLLFTEPSERGDRNIPTVKIPRRVVQGHSEELARLKGLNEELARLEDHAERLSADVQSSKAKLVDDSTIDNFISVELDLADTAEVSLQTIGVQLDGFSIYSMNTQHAGVWIPGRRMPLFAGPMIPGNHKLTVDARLALSETKGIPVNKSLFKTINDSFEVTVPPGKSRQIWRIRLQPNPDKSGAYVARLEKI